MASETQHVNTQLTSEEVKALAFLLKHPDIKKMAAEMEAKEAPKQG